MAKIPTVQESLTCVMFLYCFALINSLCKTGLSVKAHVQDTEKLATAHAHAMASQSLYIAQCYTDIL